MRTVSPRGLQFKASAVPAGLYISLNLCSMSQGLEYRHRKRDRLALDGPNAWLTLPT